MPAMHVLHSHQQFRSTAPWPILMYSGHPGKANKVRNHQSVSFMAAPMSRILVVDDRDGAFNYSPPVANTPGLWLGRTFPLAYSGTV